MPGNNTYISSKLLKIKTICATVAMSMLFRKDVENTGTASSSETSNRLFFVYTFGTAEFANASVHRP